MSKTHGYALRGFTHKSASSANDWSGRLCLDGRPVARIEAGAAGIDVEFKRVADLCAFEAFIAERTNDGAADQASIEFLLELADEAYHRRRLQVISLRHTVYRLKSDPPDLYRYLPGVRVDDAVVGRLRAAYPGGLEEVLRAGPLH